MNKYTQSKLALASIAACISCSAVTVQRDLLFHSEVMDKDIKYAVSLPKSYATDSEKVFPVLYCLHGLGAPYDTWLNMNALANATDGDYPVIIVSFDGSNSWYVDNTTDADVRYTTLFFDELVPFIESKYRAGGRKELRGVTGFSMGGFGAWHYMLERPDFFSSVSSLSGAFNRTPGGNSSPYTRITEFAESERALPPTYIHCGTSDGLITDNRNMAQHLTSKGYTTVFVESAGGHEWRFWRDSSVALLTWHYQYMTIPSPEWQGYPVNPEQIADTGDYLGPVYVEYAPWVWVYDFSSWVYYDAQAEDTAGHWGWMPR